MPRLLCVQLNFPSVGPVGQGKVLDMGDVSEAPRVTVEEQQVLPSVAPLSSPCFTLTSTLTTS